MDAEKVAATPPADEAHVGPYSATGSWPCAARNTDLVDDEIRVWSAPIDQLACRLADFAGVLSESEQKRADRYQFERDRNRFIVRHGLLRIILGGCLKTDPARVAFAYESRGKPLLSGSAHPSPIHFNLSHSDGLALIAATRQGPLGVDVERVRPIPEADQIAAKFFSPHENAMLSAVPPAQKMEAFFHCWTRKEAYLKATGEGIADALPQIEVSLTPGQPARLLSFNGDAKVASRWNLSALAPAPGFVGAMAIEAVRVRLSCWHWSDK